MEIDKAFFDKKLQELSTPSPTTSRVIWWESFLRESFHPVLLDMLEFLCSYGDDDFRWSFIDSEYVEKLTEEECEHYVRGSFDTAAHILSMIEESLGMESGALKEKVDRREEIGKRIRSLISEEDMP